MGKKFKCNDCQLEFEFEIFLTRHKNRKIPCNRKLQCERCLKKFKYKNDYKRHINRKNPCKDKKDSLNIQLELERIKLRQMEESTKTEEAKLMQEKEKTKQAKMERAQPVINIKNFNNTTVNLYIEGQFANSISLGDCKDAQLTYEELKEAYTIDKDQLTQNLFRVLYGNDDPDMEKYQCIKEYDNTLFAKIDDKIQPVNFKDVKPNILTDLHRFVDNTLQRFDPSHKMWKYSNIEGHYTTEDMAIIEQIKSYTEKPRNNASVKNALYSSIKSIERLKEPIQEIKET
jgi:hypothetical protein